MKKKKSIIIIVLAVIIIIFLAVIFSKGKPVNVSKAIKGKISEYVDQRSITSLPRVYHITIPFNSRIQEVKIAIGTPVKKDQEVAQLVQSDLQTNLKQAEAKVKAIQGQIKIIEYNALEKTAYKESLDWIKLIKAIVGVAERRVKASENVYKYAVEYRNTQILSGLGVSTIRKSQAEMEAAVKMLNVEGAILTKKSIQFLGLIFKLAPIYINEYLERKNLEKYVLQSQLADANENLSEAKRHINMSKLKSPIDGVVLKRYITNERYLAAGTAVLDIGNLNDLEVTADVLSSDAPKIKVGNEVDIYGYAVGNNSIKGKVARVDPEAFTKISSLGVEEQRVNVKISINKADFSDLKKEGKTLGFKYRVYSKIYTATKSNAVIIPRTALLKNNKGNWQVFVVQDGKAKLTNVSVGLINDDQVEILNGLKENNLVVLAPSTSLSNDNKVTYNIN
ncbi:MAG: HlyD family efflux transporter periplasmic adaptor subunit [bacterium]|nr:HlyD family efflux transporter periplasmic adaptor subunit [bacterium]